MGGVWGREENGVQLADGGVHDAESLKGGGERIAGVVFLGLSYLSQQSSQGLNTCSLSLLKWGGGGGGGRGGRGREAGREKEEGERCRGEVVKDKHTVSREVTVMCTERRMGNVKSFKFALPLLSSIVDATYHRIHNSVCADILWSE